MNPIKMALPQALTQAALKGKLLAVWGDSPFPLEAHPPANRAVAISRLLSRSTAWEPAGGLTDLPPLSVLSLDASDRVERAFAQAGMALQVVYSRQHAPARGRRSLLKLAGDLETRSGVVLSQAEIGELHSDADKRYLLDEASRAAEGGAVLLLGCDPASKGFCTWWEVLAPIFRGLGCFAVGEPAAAWPKDVTCLGPDLTTVSAGLRASQRTPAVQGREAAAALGQRVQADHGSAAAADRGSVVTGDSNIVVTGDVQGPITIVQGGAPLPAPHPPAPPQGSTRVGATMMHEAAMTNLADWASPILIITVTRTEARAVLDTFSQAAGQEWTRQAIGKKTYYSLGNHGGVPVFMVQSEMGSATPGGALLTVHQAIEALRPQAVIMCGIAFGLRPDEQQLGDIMVAKQLLYYEPQKVDLERGQMPRGDRTTSAERLLDRCRSVDIDWQGAATHFGLVLSGEKLVNDPAFRDWLLRTEPEAVGGEMEGAGLYAAARDAKVDWILVKAICDWADGTKNDDAQSLAARNAAQFVLRVLQLGGWGEA
jgi:nucleoside phosphorylase